VRIVTAASTVVAVTTVGGLVVAGPTVAVHEQVPVPLRDRHRGPLARQLRRISGGECERGLALRITDNPGFLRRRVRLSATAIRSRSHT
jgi:hypothetical protein